MKKIEGDKIASLQLLCRYFAWHATLQLVHLVLQPLLISWLCICKYLKNKFAHKGAMVACAIPEEFKEAAEHDSPHNIFSRANRINLILICY